MLFNEPKLLKSCSSTGSANSAACFSALQRAKIAEIATSSRSRAAISGFSALQRAEIAETRCRATRTQRARVSVLFNEPKLLKSAFYVHRLPDRFRFSALQRAEIAEKK